MYPDDFTPYLFTEASKKGFEQGSLVLYDKIQKKIIAHPILAANTEHGFFVFQTCEGPKMALNKNLVILVKE